MALIRFIFTAAVMGLSVVTFAKTHTVDLTMRYETVSLGEKPVRAITVNGQIPAPELRFTEGDAVIIKLHNELDEPGSIHWHGLLVPYRMDGVPWVSMPPIMPGETYQYRFTLKQSGTYWYHSHSKFHEQRGLYGAFVVEPKNEPLQYDREITMMLSDWADRHPDTTYRNLKKDGDYYKQWRPSWQFFWDQYKDADEDERNQIRKTIAHMQEMRMGVWDWGDVAYDSFLINGKPPENPSINIVEKGEKVRLRIINGGASSYFNLKIQGAEHFTVVSADGQTVEPVKVHRLLIGMAETYDLLVDIQDDHPYVIYAEAQDRTGHAIAVLKTDTNQPVPSLEPFNDPWFDDSMNHGAMHHETMNHETMNHETMNHETMHHEKMRHETMHHEATDSASVDHSKMGHSGHGMNHQDRMATRSEKLDYAQLKATFVTNDPDEDVIDITLHLTGNMERYIWSFDNVRYQDAEPIYFEEGKTYRLTLINDTMMHHPIHIHGHWFVLDTGNGKYNPRKHTIDVPPMGQRIAKVHALDSGKWVFHCHNLYHMKAGMMRLIKYTNSPADSWER
ncbi:MAG: copper resistance system multicopper oxidase [bacterium]